MSLLLTLLLAFLVGPRSPLYPSLWGDEAPDRPGGSDRVNFVYFIRGSLPPALLWDRFGALQIQSFLSSQRLPAGVE